MIWEEISIADKIIKLFPRENIALNKKFNNRKSDIWFEDYNVIIEVDEGNHLNYDTDDEIETADMFKKHNFKIFWCNSNDPNFDLFKFLGKINLYLSKLHKKIFVNGVKLLKNENYWKNSCSDKIKRIKKICQKHFAKLQKTKKINRRNKNKPIINIKYKNKMKTYCVKC